MSSERLVDARRRVFDSTDAANAGAFTAVDWGLFAAVSLIWGASFVLIDIGLDALGPGVVTWGRVAAGAAVLALARGGRGPVEPADRPRLVALSVVWVAIPFTLFPLAEQRISSATTGMLNAGTPVFAAVVAGVALRRRPGPAQAAGLVSGFVGVLVIAVNQSGGEDGWTGVVMVVAATVCYALALNIAGPLQQRYGSVTVMARMLGLATLWTLPFGLWGLRTSSLEAGPVAAVVVLGALGTGLAFAVMGALVGRVGGTRASFVTYLIPVVSLVLGIWLRGDDVSPWAAVGVVLVVVGAALASRQEASTSRSPASTSSTSSP